MTFFCDWTCPLTSYSPLWWSLGVDFVTNELIIDSSVVLYITQGLQRRVRVPVLAGGRLGGGGGWRLVTLQAGQVTQCNVMLCELYIVQQAGESVLHEVGHHKWVLVGPAGESLRQAAWILRAPCGNWLLILNKMRPGLWSILSASVKVLDQPQLQIQQIQFNKSN